MMKRQQLTKTRLPWLNRLLNSLFMALLSSFSMTVNATDLQSIGYSSLPGDRTQIVLTFSEPVTEPNSFSIDEPARIVLDFPGVHNQLDKKTQEINIGVTRSVSTVEAGNRTRTVVNLLKKAPYTLEQNDNVVMLTIEGEGGSQSSIVSSSRAVDNIDFRRGEQGEARLMIEMNDTGGSVDVRQERDTIIVDLAGISLPARLHRRLDVIDFATPVQIIDTEILNSGPRIALTTKGNFEHLAYQSDKTLVIEVKPVKEEKNEAKREQFGYKGEKLSLNFQNIEVRAVLQLLADFTGMNLVTSDTVQGNVTLRLKNVPWDQALDIILKTKGLAIRQNGNVMLIAPAAEIAAREKQELEALKQLEELEPLYTQLIEINFAKAVEIAVILSEGDSGSAEEEDEGFLSDRGSVRVDERTNSLLVRDTADQLNQIRELVGQLDIPIRQVLIESRIVIASDDFTKELGARFGASKLKDASDDFSVDAAVSGNLAAAENLLNRETLISPDRLNVDLPVTNPAGSIGLALAKLPLGFILELELSAMQAEGQGEIVSSPRVITSNQQTAIIEQGTEIPYLEASSSGATSVSFKDAVLKLEVTPQITPDDNIVMDLQVNKDEVGEVFLGVPSIDTRAVTTQVLVDNGETVILGGIYEQTKVNSSQRVPFFGDLPYVGWAFRNTVNEDTKSELLIFVTPKIIKDGLKF